MQPCNYCNLGTVANLNGSIFGESVRASLYQVSWKNMFNFTHLQKAFVRFLGFANPILLELVFSYGCSWPIRLVFLVANVAGKQLR